MDFRHLRAFVVVAEELHFTKAAQRLHISQPPLSRHIRQLEQETGVALFERTRPRVILTAAGHRLLRQAQSLVSAGEDFLRAARALGEEGTGLVKVGMAPGLWQIVNHVRARHARHFRYVTIEAADLFSHEQAESLLHNQIDVGFSRDPVNSSRLWSEQMFDERLLVLLHAEHPLARRKALRLRDLTEDTLLLHDRSRSPVAYDRALGLYAAAKIAPKMMTIASLAYDQATLLLVASGRGISLAPEHTLNRSYGPSHAVAAVPLNEPGARIPISMVWRANERSATVLQFLQSAREVMKSRSRRSEKSGSTPRDRSRQPGPRARSGRPVG
jgi:DNA-binding transcriptional LysR family regulator